MFCAVFLFFFLSFSHRGVCPCDQRASCIVGRDSRTFVSVNVFSFFFGPIHKIIVIMDNEDIDI